MVYTRFGHTYTRFTTRSNFSQPFSCIAIVFQWVCSHTMADRLYYNWIAEKNWTGSFLKLISQRSCPPVSAKLVFSWGRGAFVTLSGGGRTFRRQTFVPCHFRPGTLVPKNISSLNISSPVLLSPGLFKGFARFQVSFV